MGYVNVQQEDNKIIMEIVFNFVINQILFLLMVNVIVNLVLLRFLEIVFHIVEMD